MYTRRYRVGLSGMPHSCNCIVTKNKITCPKGRKGRRSLNFAIMTITFFRVIIEFCIIEHSRLYSS